MYEFEKPEGYIPLFCTICGKEIIGKDQLTDDYKVCCPDGRTELSIRKFTDIPREVQDQLIEKIRRIREIDPTIDD